LPSNMVRVWGTIWRVLSAYPALHRVRCGSLNHQNWTN
jgi:hypothetical protein